MADTPAAPVSGTSSTPPAAPAAAAAPAASPTPAPAATPPPAAASEPAKPATPPTGSEPKAAATPTDPAKPAEAPPLFVLPEDFKVAESGIAKFTTAIQGAMVDGKLQLTPQQVVDMYVEQARDANTAWQKQIEQVDQDNKAACQARFSAQQLAASETAVGWFSSCEPAFRDFAKRQLNDPVFVNAMRLIGESLSEEEFLPAAPPAPAKRTPAERMGYVKKSN